jgi:hypothetical protein
MTQYLALLLDAYRDLNARKMFWIVLIISFLVAGSFALVGLTPQGISIFTWKISMPYLNSSTITPEVFYKQMFVTLGVGTWLTGWLATGLALISTASLFPDFLAGGAVDLYLSKPIGRLRLFLFKYSCGLLFVALQIGCFCLASFLVIGLRGHAWEPGLFFAVPIVVVFYSYLFCICVLIGVLTRSTVGATLLTLFFWLFVFLMHSGETMMLGLKLGQDAQARSLDVEIRQTEAEIARATPHTDTQPTSRQTARLTRLQDQLESERTRRSEFRGQFDRPHQLFYALVTVLPKTTETVELLQRELIKKADLPQQDEDASVPLNGDSNNTTYTVQVGALQNELRNRSIGWIVGSSLGFEVVVVGLAAWVFCRRDY